MKSVTTDYYLLEELPEGARRRAYETWADHWMRNADACLGPSVDEDLGSLRHALGSIGCKLAKWEVNYSGWGVNTCKVEVEDGLAYDMGDWRARSKEPALDGLPAAESDGCWIAEGFAERWNSQCKPKLDAMLAEMAEAYAACSDGEFEQVADVRGGALHDAYLGLAQEQADKCMAEIGDDVESFWSEEGFVRDNEANGWYYEQDGTYAGHV